MPFEDFVTVREASETDEVPYTTKWIKHLIQVGRVKGTKIGTRRRGQWLVHLPSLMEYVERMRELGTQKHAAPVQFQEDAD